MKNFLVVNTSYFGDTILTSGLCRNIKKRFPDSNITFIVNKPFFEIAKYMDGVDQVWIYDKFGEHKGIKGILKFFNENKNKTKFEAAFVMYGNERGILLAKLFGINKIFADNNNFFVRMLLTNKKINYGKHEHVQDQFAYLFQLYTGDGFYDQKMKYNVPVEAKEYVEKNLLSKLNTKYIVLNTTTKSVDRDLKLDVSIKIIDEIAKLGMQVVLVGAGSSAADYYEKLPVEEKSNVINCINKTSISQLGAVLEGAELLVTPDTGTMHFALALDVPVVAIFYVNNKKHLNKWAPKEIYNAVVVADDFSAENIWRKVKSFLKV